MVFPELHTLSAEAVKVNDFAVYQNYPNPFNPVTLIMYKVPVESSIQIEISNALGEKVETLVNEVKPSGIHEITWNGSSYSSGIYYYTVKMNSLNSLVKSVNKSFKMLLVK